MRALWVAAVVVVLAASCGSDGSEPATPVVDDPSTSLAADPSDGDGLFPDVVAVEMTPGDGGTWTVHATLSSPYDSPDRYADAWRVLDEQGAVLGLRELAHDHAAEQPFTRSLSDVAIPDDVETVTVEGRDQRNGWGGATVSVAVPDG